MRSKKRQRFWNLVFDCLTAVVVWVLAIVALTCAAGVVDLILRRYP
ncbi:MAG: hypothetical protein OXJ37_18045 [Bryobacterales bacterium]|nr:hypothetical protein [Bryobacterales bacterium]MDE0264312.1 hypothetical protein [Bryobacterales bacterium]MDE0622802.1 hypothetical protein [Bryobacterales bacterium]